MPEDCKTGAEEKMMNTDLMHLLIFIDSILCGACDLGLTRNYTDFMIKKLAPHFCSTF